MPIDYDILIQTLNGYSEINRIHEIERYKRLKTRTNQESMYIFSDLYRTWVQSGKQASGDRKILAQLHLEQKIQFRLSLKKLAQKEAIYNG